VPVKYVYPSRTKLLRSLNLALAATWLITYGVLLASYPDPHPVVVALSLAYLAYYVAVSVWLTIRGQRASVQAGQPGR
jgi:phosphatidylcholine synthase